MYLCTCGRRKEADLGIVADGTTAAIGRLGSVRDMHPTAQGLWLQAVWHETVHQITLYVAAVCITQVAGVSGQAAGCSVVRYTRALAASA